MAAIIEASHDDAGIKWPEAVAPFKVAILNLKQGDGAIPTRPARSFTRAARRKGVDVLYDDLDERPGAKFATADLIGIPWQVLIGPKGLAAGQVELKKRSDGSREMLSPDDVLTRSSALCTGSCGRPGHASKSCSKTKSCVVVTRTVIGKA